MRHGTVASIDSSSNTFTVDSRSGTAVKVDVNTKTIYQAIGAGSTETFSDLKVGDRVVVAGTPSTSGAVAATSVTILPAGGFRGGFGGPPGASSGNSGSGSSGLGNSGIPGA